MKRLVTLLVAMAVLASFVACAAPPAEVIEKEVIVEKEVPVTVEVVKEVVVEKEVPVEIKKTVVEFWTTDNEEDRVNVYEAVAAGFMAEHPDIQIEISEQPVDAWR